MKSVRKDSVFTWAGEAQLGPFEFQLALGDHLSKLSHISRLCCGEAGLLAALDELLHSE